MGKITPSMIGIMAVLVLAIGFGVYYYGQSAGQAFLVEVQPDLSMQLVNTVPGTDIDCGVHNNQGNCNNDQYCKWLKLLKGCILDFGEVTNNVYKLETLMYAQGVTVNQEGNPFDPLTASSITVPEIPHTESSSCSDATTLSVMARLGSTDSSYLTPAITSLGLDIYQNWVGTYSYDCSSLDTSTPTGQTQWISASDCIEKEQTEEQQELYGCSDGACVSQGINTVWVDTGSNRDKADGTFCSNGECQSGTCVGPVCGDDICDDDMEDCSSCPDDCGFCGPQCGDNSCEEGEDCSSCEQDCGVCLGFCGNNICEEEEGEDCNTCGADCDVCPTECGNNIKEQGEQCDGSNLNGETCQDLLNWTIGGTLGCTVDCLFNTTGCY